MDRGDWWATVHRVTKESDMTERITNNKLVVTLKGTAHVVLGV